MAKDNSFSEEDKNLMAVANEAYASATSTKPIWVRQGNIIDMKDLIITHTMFGMLDEMELVEVRTVQAYGEDRKPIPGKIDSINYTCVDGKNWYTFKVPNQSAPIISQEEIDQRNEDGNPVFVKIPLEKTVFKPYRRREDWNVLRLSIQIPYIEILQ